MSTENLHKRIVALGLTQKRLAIAADLHQGTISRYMRGRQILSDKAMEKIISYVERMEALQALNLGRCTCGRNPQS